jgi:putative sigma-54 modulation protein
LDIRISGKHLDVNARLRAHVEEKLGKLEKFAKKVIEARVVLKVEKYLHIAEITLLGKDLRFYGEGRSEENFFPAIDEAAEKMGAQLKKRREKLKNHKVFSRREIAEMASLAAVPGREAFAVRGKEGRIIRDARFSPRPMSLEEARSELERSGKPFLVFRNLETDGVNVLYRREDGNFGWIESGG